MTKAYRGMRKPSKEEDLQGVSRKYVSFILTSLKVNAKCFKLYAIILE